MKHIVASNMLTASVGGRGKTRELQIHKVEREKLSIGAHLSRRTDSPPLSLSSKSAHLVEVDRKISDHFTRCGLVGFWCVLIVDWW